MEIEGKDVSGQTPDELRMCVPEPSVSFSRPLIYFQSCPPRRTSSTRFFKCPKYPGRSVLKGVARNLSMVGLSKYARHRPNQLSGGQRQRVAIARALVTNSRVVLADEPTANLDRRTGESILNLMRDINQNSGTTFVFSTHDKRVMNRADRLVRMEDGKITALGLRRDGAWLFVQDLPTYARRRSRYLIGF